MIRVYESIGHFGMVSLLFFYFFCLFTHTTRTSIFKAGVAGPSDFARGPGTRQSARSPKDHLN